MSKQQTIWTAALTAASLVVGCGFDGFGDDHERPPTAQTPAPAPVPTTPSAPANSQTACLGPHLAGEAASLYSAIDNAVHELITCGRAQVGLAQTLALRVLVSNPDAIDLEPETRDLFETVLGFVDGGASGFVRDGSGTFRMGNQDDSGGVAFELRFQDDGGALISYDPLQLDNYLEGVTVTAALTHEEMWSDWSRRNDYRFEFEAPGPLAYLLSDHEQLDGGFTLSFSFDEIISTLLGGDENIDFGPFEGLGSVLVDSDVTFRRSSGGNVIDYTALGRQTAVADLASSQSVDFDMVDMIGRRGRMDLWPLEENLVFVDRGSLAGTIRWAVDHDGQRIAEVLSDFGTGRAYPVVSWTCDVENTLAAP